MSGRPTSHGRGFRVGARHTLIACENVPSGRHRWMGDEDCVRCGRNYYEVTKNWTGAERKRKRRERTHIYRTVVADPPWPQKGGGSLKGREGFLDAGGRSLDLPYATMTLEEIAALRPPAAAAAHLYLWTTSGFLREAFAIVKAWGFVYSTTLVWAKRPIGHGLGGAYGIATEFVLYARRGTLPAMSKVGRNWFDWKRPYDERGKPRHSAKPPEFYAMVEQVSPGPYLEMFARDFRLGWDAWGDEAWNPIEIPA